MMLVYNPCIMVINSGFIVLVFIERFCIYSNKGHWSVVFFQCLGLADLKGVPSFLLFYKCLRRIGANSS